MMNSGSAPELPRFTGWLRPAVNAVARSRTTIHRKLLVGFLTGALLLVGMAVLSLVVIGRMDHRMHVLDEHAVKVDRAQQLLYDVTAQSHQRAMALLTHTQDPVGAQGWNAKVEATKAKFTDLVSTMAASDPGDAEFFARLTAANEKYAQAGREVMAAYNAGRFDLATDLHLSLEHPASHVLEDLLDHCTPTSSPTSCAIAFIPEAQAEMDQASEDFDSDRSLLTIMIIVFSVVSVGTAIILGLVLSSTFAVPVRRMQAAFAGITSGDLSERVDVVNRDEFGSLATDMNKTTEKLSDLFSTQEALAGSLREANVSLETASEAKSRFLASVSHELRTPMNAILGFTDALLAGVDGPLNPDQTESLVWVQRGGRDLLELINEILDLSKIESGKLTLEIAAFDPRPLIAAAVAQHQSIASQKGLEFTWVDDGAPAEVWLDQQRVRQIVVNMMGNALKFTQQGAVYVRADTEAGTESGTDSGQQSGAVFHVSVRDTGAGIAAEQHETIFEEFLQAGGGASGTGLGLAISRRLARAMGGDVTVESAPGQGSTFHLRLPVGEPAPNVADAAQAKVGAGEQIVLSLDDDQSVAPLLQKMLMDTDFRVVAWHDPLTFVAEARRLQPVVVLLDLVMPARSGGDVLRELKGDPSTSSIPVIVMSVIDSSDVPDMADGILVKPVRQDDLLGALAAHSGGQ